LALGSDLIIKQPTQSATASIPSLRATEHAPDDRLREASRISSVETNLDCFVAYAPLRKRFAFVAGNGVEQQETSFDVPAA
jgi:hypothetical protein